MSKKKKNKSKIYTKLTIHFNDGSWVQFEKNDWDDYDYNVDFIIVKNNGAWAAMYAANNVKSLELT